jgi:5-methylcytosine-specific restriction endonuclease McrA
MRGGKLIPSSAYRHARWQHRRALQLQAEPLCRMCAARGFVVPAEVVDHVEPHHYDPRAFFEGELQSLCKPCHDGPKQRVERRGFHSAVGPDGFPIDVNHPFNRAGREPEGG